ncbi:hypothetical protein ABZ318_39040, partial [Streptomyces sp. NPDC006197]|uniref:hypothetical protein n=1 Tax=Streptomyces sp. NPDC006197 TaxID=3156685 RepID=UPI0033AABF65
ACRILKAEGLRVILVNSNPATGSHSASGPADPVQPGPDRGTEFTERDRSAPDGDLGDGVRPVPSREVGEPVLAGAVRARRSGSPERDLPVLARCESKRSKYGT